MAIRALHCASFACPAMFSGCRRNAHSLRAVATRFNWIARGAACARPPGSCRCDLRSPPYSGRAKTHELVVSGTTSAAAPSYYPRLMNKLLGTKFKVVDGYKSSQEALLALERGEVDGHCSGSLSAALWGRIEPWVSAGKVKILAQIGREKNPDYPDVPLILDLAASAADRQIMELALTPR